jgi:hypothetical protein
MNTNLDQLKTTTDAAEKAPESKHEQYIQDAVNRVLDTIPENLTATQELKEFWLQTIRGTIVYKPKEDGDEEEYIIEILEKRFPESIESHEQLMEQIAALQDMLADDSYSETEHNKMKGELDLLSERLDDDPELNPVMMKIADAILEEHDEFQQKLTKEIQKTTEKGEAEKKDEKSKTKTTGKNTKKNEKGTISEPTPQKKEGVLELDTKKANILKQEIARLRKMDRFDFNGEEFMIVKEKPDEFTFLKTDGSGKQITLPRKKFESFLELNNKTEPLDDDRRTELKNVLDEIHTVKKGKEMATPIAQYYSEDAATIIKQEAERNPKNKSALLRLGALYFMNK